MRLCPVLDACDKHETKETEETKNLRSLQGKWKSAHRCRLQQYVAGLDSRNDGGLLLATGRYQLLIKRKVSLPTVLEKSGKWFNCRQSTTSDWCNPR
jgi:hypothetical protein